MDSVKIFNPYVSIDWIFERESRSSFVHEETALIMS
jgi:hypothetical protein